MARLYADEQFPRPVVEHLRSLGHDILTVQEAGNAGNADQNFIKLAERIHQAISAENA
jgi:hypothetical protein